MPSITPSIPIDMHPRPTLEGTSFVGGSSLEQVNPCEAFEKRPALRVFNTAPVVANAKLKTNSPDSCLTPVLQDSELVGCDPQFPLLPGEYVVEYGGVGKSTRLYITNYRVFIHLQEDNSFYNVPLVSLDAAEVKDLFALLIYCKDGKVIRVNCSNNEDCKMWLDVITRVTTARLHIKDVFAPCLKAWSDGHKPPWLSHFPMNPLEKTHADTQFKRLEFDDKWRMTDANNEYKLCDTYPRWLIVPSSITDDKLPLVGRERFLRRLPVAVWRHKKQGSVLLRSSQPAGGFLGLYRCSEDEHYLKAILESSPSKPVLILDARSYTSAWANRAKGGGYETVECYPNCDIQFQGLPNIHVVRANFQSLRSLLCSDPDPNNFLQSLQNTNWLSNVSCLLSAAVRVMETLNDEGRSVLVHCSDGWDRTAQIVSLAKLLLDPHYRTHQGFRELVESEWVEFGHKFSDRCGVVESNPNERSPVFLQWLDCVSQIHRQYPSAFQFNSLFLIKLAQHAYSGLFGTFLCNSAMERDNRFVASKTYSVWEYLNHHNEALLNWMYMREEHGSVLWPRCFIKDLVLWKELYSCGAEPIGGRVSRPRSTNHLSSSPIPLSMERSLTRAHSYDSLTGIMPPDSPMTHSHEVPTTLQLGTKSGSESDLARSPSLSSLGSVQSQVCGVLEKVVRRVSATEDSETRTGPKIIKPSSAPIIIVAVEGMSTSTTDISDSLVPQVQAKCQLDNGVGPVVRLQQAVHLMMDPHPQLTPVKKRTVTDWIDFDGLTKVDDVPNDRLAHKLRHMKSQYEHVKSEIAQVCLDLQSRGSAPASLGRMRIEREEWLGIESGSEGRSLDSGGVSEGSWDCVDGDEGGAPTCWIPDHAVLNCMGCDAPFGVLVRKHHCRSCGKVFCHECSNYTSVVPKEQLNNPVRVCAACHQSLTTHNSNCQSTRPQKVAA